jgi:RimJ/RimL family protein N-acetyltransferase
LQRPNESEFVTVAPTLNGSKIILRPKQIYDAADDYEWRKDSELCTLDAAQPITHSFEEYLKYASGLPSCSRWSCHFAIATLDGKHIGNCSYFDIDTVSREAEIGIMIGDKDYWDRGYGTDTISTALHYIFSQTNLNRIYLKTLEWNIRAQKCFQKCGFKSCGRLSRDGYSFLLMETRRPTI